MGKLRAVARRPKPSISMKHQHVEGVNGRALGTGRWALGLGGLGIAGPRPEVPRVQCQRHVGLRSRQRGGRGAKGGERVGLHPTWTGRAGAG